MAKAPFKRDDSYDEPVNVEMDPEDAVRLMLTEPTNPPNSDEPES